MKKDRKRKIFTLLAAAILAVVIAAFMLLGRNGIAGEISGTETQEGTVRFMGQQETGDGEAWNEPTPHAGESEKQKKSNEGETFPLKILREDTPATRYPAQEETFQQPETEPGTRTAGRTDVRTETTGTTEEVPETTAHVHRYVLAGTEKTEHPAVTEQVWVEDAAAWDEVIRPGYHMSVVTCHECGMKFSDPSQGRALEAWGNHIDEAHDGDGGYDMASSYDVPPETVHHDAAGHYEIRTIRAAWTEYTDTYLCSCGDRYTAVR